MEESINDSEKDDKLLVDLSEDLISNFTPIKHEPDSESNTKNQNETTYNSDINMEEKEENSDHEISQLNSDFNQENSISLNTENESNRYEKIEENKMTENYATEELTDESKNEEAKNSKTRTDENLDGNDKYESLENESSGRISDSKNEVEKDVEETDEILNETEENEAQSNLFNNMEEDEAQVAIELVNKEDNVILEDYGNSVDIEENLKESEFINENEFINKESSTKVNNDDKGVSASFDDPELPDKPEETVENSIQDVPASIEKLGEMSNFFTVHIQLDDGSVKNQIVTVIKNKGKKPFLGGFRHKMTRVEFHNAAVQTRPRPRPPPTVQLFSRDTQTFQIRHQKINTNNTTSTQMTRPGVFVSNANDKLLIPGKYETADEYKDRMLENIIIIQKYYRRWLAKHIVDQKRKQRDERLEWEHHDKELKQKEKEERIKREYERRMHPKTRADFDLLYNGLEKWRQEQLAEIENTNISVAEKKAAKLLLLDDETDLLAAIDRHKIDRKQQNKGEEVQKLLSKAAAPKSWKDTKGRKIQMDTPYTIRSRELLDILNSLNMQYLTQDERLDVLLTLKHTVKEHDCKLTRDIIDLVDREADLIMRNVKDNNLAGLRKRIVTLYLQYCKTPTFNPEISLLLKVPPDPTVLIGNINYCKYCGRYLSSTEFSLSTKSSKLTICKSCARKENQSRNRQDYSYYRRILKDLQMDEQQIEDDSKIAFIFKQNDIKTLMESVWDNKSVLSECEDLDELVFVRWDFKEHWSPWNAILITKEEAEAHKKVKNISEIYSNVMINRINQKHVIAKNMFESLEKMISKVNYKETKSTLKV